MVGGQRDPAFAALVDSQRETLLRAARLLTGDWAAANRLMDETVGWARDEGGSLTRSAAVRLRQRMVSAYLADAADAGAGSKTVRHRPPELSFGTVRGWGEPWPGASNGAGTIGTPEETSSTDSTPWRPSLLAGLAVLSAEDRAIVVARYYLALSAAEIGEALDLDEAQVDGTAAGLVKSLRRKAEGAGEPA